MAILIDGVLSETALQDRAGEEVFARGQSLVGDVRDISRTQGGASATVRGTIPYRTDLTWDGGGINGSCTCPHAARGNMCKHQVAVGLAVLDDARQETAAPAEQEEAPPERDAVAEYLAGLDAEQLRELVVFVASHSPEATRALRTAADLAAGDGQAVQDELMENARSILGGRGFLGYREAMDFAVEAQHCLDELEQVLDSGHADIVAPVLLWATTRLRKRMETNVDDSSGMVGDACQRAVELYARACREGHPDPAKLGRWLAKFRLESPGWPEVSLADFAPALGPGGVAAYRKATNAAIAKAGKDDGRYGFNFESHEMLLELADYDGDVDRAVELLLEGEYPRYQAAVDRLVAAERQREAMALLDRAVAGGFVQTRNLSYWRQRGMGSAIDPARAVDLYLADGRHEDAIGLTRDLFRRQPTPEIYDLLLDTAKRLGRFDDERDETLAWIDSQEWRSADTAVAIALHEGDADRAWRAVDRWKVGSMWQELADAVPQPRPRDAIELYMEAADHVLIQPGRDNARRAAKMAVRMREIARGSEPADTAQMLEESITTWVAEIRQTHRRRPTVADEFRKAGF